jgi:hypothetical protein
MARMTLDRAKYLVENQLWPTVCGNKTIAEAWNIILANIKESRPTVWRKPPSHTNDTDNPKLQYTFVEVIEHLGIKLDSRSITEHAMYNTARKVYELLSGQRRADT